MKKQQKEGGEPLKPTNIHIAKEPGRPLDHPAWQNSALKPGIIQFESTQTQLSISTEMIENMDCCKKLDSSNERCLD